LKFIFHGAAYEVGRSCIELITKRYTRVLLDAGVKLGSEGTQFPERVTNLSELDAVFISHAHLDHTGALPLFTHQGMECPIYATSATAAITKILLKDAYEIGKLHSPGLNYFEEDIYKALGFVKFIRKKEQGKINDIGFRFYNAGHIPGSSSIMLNVENKNILYTGDFNTTPTRLLNEAAADYGEDVDILITEATYGDRDHPPREKTEKDFLDAVEQASCSGNVLIPVFAVGRAQEIALMMAKKNFNVPVYMDGMAVDATITALKNPNSIKDENLLRKALDKITMIKNTKQRLRALQQKGIFISTAGMLTGGPVMDYLRHLGQSKTNSILLTGYQNKGTNGRSLLENSTAFIDGYSTRIKCSLKQFDFSAHCGMSELKRFIRAVDPETVMLNHGDPHSVESLYEWAHSLDYKVHAPKICDEITT